MTNQLFINNEFIESKSTETMDVINPATGENLIQLRSRLKKKSMKRLKNLNTLNSNGNVSSTDSAEHVKLLIPLLEQNRDEIAQLYVKEQGKHSPKLMEKLINQLHLSTI